VLLTAMAGISMLSALFVSLLPGEAPAGAEARTAGAPARG
jgi:hypothetical protein